MNTFGKSIEELKALAHFDQLYFPHPWTHSQWIELNPEYHLLYEWGQVALDGFSLFQCIKGDETAHLLKICLKPELRGSGQAEQFWDVIKQDLQSRLIKSIFLEVESSNDRAIGYYRKLGFQNLRVIKGFYSSGSDALTMQLML